MYHQRNLDKVNLESEPGSYAVRVGNTVHRFPPNAAPYEAQNLGRKSKMHTYLGWVDNWALFRVNNPQLAIVDAYDKEAV